MSGGNGFVVPTKPAASAARPSWIMPAVTAFLVAYCALAVMSMHLEPRGYDWDHHMFRVQEIAWLWSHGTFWPEVSPFMAGNSLLPVYAVYSPFPYFPAVVLHLLGMPPLLSLFVVAGAAMLAFACVLLSWLTSALGPIRGGLACVAIFSSAYFQANLFARFAYPELLALCVLPLAARAIWSVLLRCTSVSFARAELATAIVFLLHPLTFANCAVFATMFLVARVVVRPSADSSARVGRLLLLLALAPVGSACLTYPLVSNLSEVRGQWSQLVQWITPPRLNPGLIDPLWLWSGLALALLFTRASQTLRRSILWPLVVVAASAIFLSLHWSQWLWAHMAWPRVNLFPWRLIPFYVWPALIVVCAWLPQRRAWIGAAALIVAIQVATQVELGWMMVDSRDTTRVDLAQVFATYATRRTGWGVDEFLPTESEAQRLPFGEAPLLPYDSKHVHATRVVYDCGSSGCAPGSVTLEPYYRERLRFAIDGVALKPVAVNADWRPMIVVPAHGRRISVEVVRDPWSLPSQLWSVIALVSLVLLRFRWSRRSRTHGGTVEL